MLKTWLTGLLLVALSLGRVAAAAQIDLAPEERNWLTVHKTITVGVTQEQWPPYQSMHNGQLQGLSPDYLRTLADMLQVKLQPKVYPSLLALFAAMCRGEVDVAMNLSMTPQRTECMSFTEPYLDVPPVIVARKDDLRYHNDGSLPNARIAYEKDTATENWLKRRMPNAIGIPAVDTAAGLQLVEDGRADVYLGDPYVIALVLGDEATTNLGIYAQGIIATSTIHFATPRDRLPLLRALNTALKQLTPEQRKQIQSRWLNNSVGVGVRDTGLVLTKQERQWLASLPPLRLGFDPAWAPISYIDAKGQPSGITADYLDRVAEALGIQFVYVPSSNWAETLELARNGKIDVIAPISAMPDPDSNLLRSQPFATSSDVIVVAQNRATPLGVDDLMGRSVVISNPREIPESIQRRMADARVTLTGSAEEGLRMVADGRADAYIGNAAVADQQIRSRFAGTLKIAASADIVSAQSIGISRQYAQLLPYIDRALASIPEKDQQRIRSTWLWSNYTSGLAWRTF